MAKAEVTVPLGIPEVRVLKTEINKQGELLITIESTEKGRIVAGAETGSRNHMDMTSGCE